jgi:comEA protein
MAGLKQIQTALVRLLGRIRGALEQFYSPREIASVGWFLLAGILVLVFRLLSDPSAPLLDPAKRVLETQRTDSIFRALAARQLSDAEFDTLPRHFSLPAEQADRLPEADRIRPKSAKPLPHVRAIALNAATREQLERLPGIGPTMAERIIAYRNERGRFRTVDELTNVQGIGAKKFEKVSTYLRLD